MCPQVSEHEVQKEPEGNEYFLERLNAANEQGFL